jgi:hypothetical protein
LESKTDTTLTYLGEDEQFYLLKDGKEGFLRMPKGRAVQESFHQVQVRPLAPVYRLLAIALLGLAPAGLGTLLLVPLALVWTIWVILTHSLDKTDRKRAAIVLGVCAGLLGVAVPLGLIFLASLA